MYLEVVPSSSASPTRLSGANSPGHSASTSQAWQVVTRTATAPTLCVSGKTFCWTSCQDCVSWHRLYLRASRLANTAPLLQKTVTLSHPARARVPRQASAHRSRPGRQRVLAMKCGKGTSRPLWSDLFEMVPRSEPSFPRCCLTGAVRRL